MKTSTLWLTGLSDSGKSTIANAIAKHLKNLEIPTYIIDGDVLRTGLCKSLGFSIGDRKENIRRAAEVAKILNDAGIFVIAALISPLAEDREIARTIIGDKKFMDAYISTPLAICEERDVKGIYKKARSGLLQDFTGISSPYEPPPVPWVSIDTSDKTIEEATAPILIKLQALFSASF